jgi:hypothetical protein
MNSKKMKEEKNERNINTHVVRISLRLRGEKNRESRAQDRKKHQS